MKQKTLLRMNIILLIAAYVLSITTIILGIIQGDGFWFFVGMIGLFVSIIQTSWHKENSSPKTSSTKEDKK